MAAKVSENWVGEMFESGKSRHIFSLQGRSKRLAQYHHSPITAIASQIQFSSHVIMQTQKFSAKFIRSVCLMKEETTEAHNNNNDNKIAKPFSKLSTVRG